MVDIFLKKKKNIDLIIQKIFTSFSIIFFNYFGVTAFNFDNIRKEVRKNQMEILIIQNNILKLVLKNSIFESIIKDISGPTLIIIANFDLYHMVKLSQDYVKNSFLKPISIVVNKIIYNKERFFEVALLTSFYGPKYSLYYFLKSLLFLFLKILFFLAQNILYTLIKIYKKKIICLY